jgi:hypothetical protein
MKSLVIAASAVCLIASVAGAQNAQNAPTSQPVKESFNDKYGVLSEKNMFLRDRPKPRERTRAPTTTRVEQPPPTPEQTLVLRGIVVEEGELRAYFENSRSGEIKRVAPGEEVASGRITDIQIDAVQFTREAQPIWIEIGHNLTGAVAIRSMATTAPTTNPTTEPTTGPSIGTSGTTDPKLMSKEEEMKARRKKK